jgi:hypothetical protein
MTTSNGSQLCHVCRKNQRCFVRSVTCLGIIAEHALQAPQRNERCRCHMHGGAPQKVSFHDSECWGARTMIHRCTWVFHVTDELPPQMPSSFTSPSRPPRPGWLNDSTPDKKVMRPLQTITHTKFRTIALKGLRLAE